MAHRGGGRMRNEGSNRGNAHADAAALELLFWLIPRAVDAFLLSCRVAINETTGWRNGDPQTRLGRAVFMWSGWTAGLVGGSVGIGFLLAIFTPISIGIVIPLAIVSAIITTAFIGQFVGRGAYEAFRFIKPEHIVRVEHTTIVKETTYVNTPPVVITVERQPAYNPEINQYSQSGNNGVQPSAPPAYDAPSYPTPVRPNNEAQFQPDFTKPLSTNNVPSYGVNPNANYQYQPGAGTHKGSVDSNPVPTNNAQDWQPAWN